MKMQMQMKTIYEPPVIATTQVEMEEGIAQVVSPIDPTGIDYEDYEPGDTGNTNSDVWVWF